MAAFSEGERIVWDWGEGVAAGSVVAVYTQKRTLTIDGTEVTRNASADCPSYKIKQDDGQTVFKSHSEVREAD